MIPTNKDLIETKEKTITITGLEHDDRDITLCDIYFDDVLVRKRLVVCFCRETAKRRLERLPYYNKANNIRMDVVKLTGKANV